MPDDFAGADVGEGDRGELRSVGDHGVERKLRRVGRGAEPICWLCGAGLVVEDDFAGGFAAVQLDVDAIDANVEAERTDADVALGFFEGLDGEGRAFGGLVVEPGSSAD